MNEPAQKIAVITGAAQGLGREAAGQLAARGWGTAVADINETAGREAVEKFQGQGAHALFVPTDLKTAEGPERLIRSVVDHFGRLDVLINCAAFATAEAFLEMTASSWEETLLVNVRGIALAMAAAGRQMAKQGGGRIINITSPASRMALPNYAAYAASKAAVDSLTRSAAVALADKNIQVNSVAPGMMNTPMQLKTETLFAALEGRTDLEAFLAARTARIPLGRRTTCEEVAETIVWLAAEAPPYITAARLNVSGGLDKD
ncbi:MAG: SDR family oxidoreductase [Verrucomicrobiae bacterium]|nr:SDR family oxidoreductase [Verrucomicrobiae bacterium]